MPENPRRKEKELKERIEKKLSQVREDLNIDKRFEINSEVIKEKIEAEHNRIGFWTLKSGIHDNENATILTKW